MKIALGVEYDGSQFHGWQKQTDVRSIQACLEDALATVAGHAVRTVCAGRTDTGVHATGQVIHFETDSERPDHAWVLGVNTYLPDDISVLWSKVAADDFHARLSATARRYQYLVLNRRTPPAVKRQFYTWHQQPLNEKQMAEAARYLLGEQDFTSFRASGCQSKSRHRRIDFIHVTRQAELITIDIQANAFLHHMVRNIAGVLLTIGSGKQPPEWAQTVLLAKDRRTAAKTAAPNGLCLVAVHYPYRFNLT